MRQEGVLLAFVEAVHFIDKHDGALLHQPVARGLGLLHRLADILDPAQHGADADELRIKRVGHEPRDGGLAHARRAPQDATVRTARLKREPQRHALAQHMLLADHLAQRAGPQALGQGLVAGWVRRRRGGGTACCHGRVLSTVG